MKVIIKIKKLFTYIYIQNLYQGILTKAAYSVSRNKYLRLYLVYTGYDDTLFFTVPAR